MSLIAMKWAWQQELPASQKLVLVAMADHANKEEGICWPSLDFLAEKTGLCTRTIKEARRQLRQKALIEVLRPGKYKLCHPVEAAVPVREVSFTASQKMPRAKDSPLRASAALGRASPAPSYKKPQLKPEINLPNGPKGLTIKESQFFLTWLRYEKNGFRDLADVRKTNPAEARKAMIALIQKETPKIIPYLSGENK